MPSEQSFFSAVTFVRELVGMNSEQVQQSRVIVVVVHDVGDGVVAEFVGGSVCAAAFETAAGQPHRESVRVVVSADFARTGVVLDDRQASHLASPMDDG